MKELLVVRMGARINLIKKMSVISNGKLIIECDECKHRNSFDCDELEFDVVETNDRPMGPESHHLSEFDFECRNCGAEINVEYSVWEYSTGSFNDEGVEVEGGNVIQKCSIMVEPN